MNHATTTDPLLHFHDPDGELRQLWQMTAVQRVAAMRRGDLSYRQLAAWSGRFPEQIPRVNGEFEWIAAFTPEAWE